MKRKLCFLFVLPLLFTACENVLPIEEVDLSSMVAEFTTPTKTVTFEGHVVDMDYLVTSADLETYLELQPNSPNGIKRPVKSVEAKGPNADVTLMYVVNYDKGWEILSADKRAQPVLAFSDGGEFSFETANPGEKVWLEGLACDVLNLRTADKALQTRAAENNPNVGFWRGLELRKKMMEEELEMMTRWEIPDSIDFPFDPRPDRPIIPSLPEGGHYEYSDTYESYTLETEIGHMTTTVWGQGYPWNVKCPLKSTGSDRVPAGCTAVAVAQVLYFMHDKVGVPTMAPTNAYFTGQYNPKVSVQNFDFTMGSMDTGVWDNMALAMSSPSGNRDLVASFLAHIGYLVDMKYTDGGSSSNIRSALEDGMNAYGITGTLLSVDDYVSYRVVDNLRDSLVVYARASTDNDEGHAFVIDGYQDYKITYNDVYEWVWDEPQDPYGNQVKVPIRTVSRPSNNVKCLFVCMNWGWSGTSNNESGAPRWYALETNRWVTDDYTFTHSRAAIVDIRTIN